MATPADHSGAQTSVRRSDYDITDTVQVSSPRAVLRAVGQLLASAWPTLDQRPLERAFTDFDLLFAGRFPGYSGVETVYHDRQHTLDVTLTMARLLVGYERQVEKIWQLGAERSLVGVILALFHDIGYLRRAGDPANIHGAEFTRTHVSRGAEFLAGYLPQLGLGAWQPVTSQIIHFTGYERPFTDIVVEDARDLRLGHLLGTADMVTQLADRCYLEKCRDRLYPEFVLGGMAMSQEASGRWMVRYASGLDLLRQTPGFVAETRRSRLDGEFRGAYRYLEILFGGRNPYIEAIDRNMQFLQRVLRSENWQLLRRSPPLSAASPEALSDTRIRMLNYFKKSWLHD
ncbi:MAG TPA: HD domain-containing protein [Steroidobacteraceae bacterium]|nr:HD domain-containing protein [Steroidobacteraceae bacterium]